MLSYDLSGHSIRVTVLLIASYPRDHDSDGLFLIMLFYRLH
jgi:hypothetical protein